MGRTSRMPPPHSHHAPGLLLDAGSAWSAPPSALVRARAADRRSDGSDVPGIDTGLRVRVEVAERGSRRAGGFVASVRTTTSTTIIAAAVALRVLAPHFRGRFAIPSCCSLSRRAKSSTGGGGAGGTALTDDPQIAITCGPGDGANGDSLNLSPLVTARRSRPQCEGGEGGWGDFKGYDKALGRRAGREAASEASRQRAPKRHSASVTASKRPLRRGFIDSAAAEEALGWHVQMLGCSGAVVGGGESGGGDGGGGGESGGGGGESGSGGGGESGGGGGESGGGGGGGESGSGGGESGGGGGESGGGGGGESGSGGGGGGERGGGGGESGCGESGGGGQSGGGGGESGGGGCGGGGESGGGGCRPAAPHGATWLKASSWHCWRYVASARVTSTDDILQENAREPGACGAWNGEVWVQIPGGFVP
ncbi:unnamed protein product [Lampetra fluviatilis]